MECRRNQIAILPKAIGSDTFYREITDKIIAELEQGFIAHVQSWSGNNHP